MTSDPYVWLACSLMALAMASLGLFCGDLFSGPLRWIERDLTEKLRRMRTPTKKLRQYLVLWMAAIVFVFFGFWLFLGNIVFAILISVMILFSPWYLIRRLAERRRMKIEDQLADSMVTLANAVRAGLSLAQSMEILAAQCPKPINAEFFQIAAEYKLGKPLDRTLVEARQRLKSENFALFAAALLASHESGGRLNETVERIAQSVLEMQRLERKVKSETAQARKSAIYMALAPAVILGVYYLVDPVNTQMLFTRLFGQVLLGIALTINVLAYFWARAILNPDI
jgi:tight adherence protein B